MRLGLGLGLMRTLGESTPPIITQNTPASFGPYVAGDTPEDAYTPGTYLTTVGDIDTVEAVWTVNGSPADGTDVLAEDDVVGLSELVTNTNADERTFGYGTAVVAFGDVTPPGIFNISVDVDLITMELTEVATVYMLRNTSATPLTGAAIKAGAEDDWATLPEGENILSIDNSLWTPDIYYLHFAGEDAALNISAFGEVVEWTQTGVPDQFGSGDWSVADDATGGDITITITALPDDNYSALTALQYQIDGGSWTSLGGTTTGDYPVSGLTDDVEVDVAIRAVNAIGNGTASATKAVTPTASSGTTFTETWSGYTAGDVNADLITGGYTFSTSPPSCVITSDAESTSGLANYGTGTTASIRHGARDDITSALASGWTSIEVLFKIRTTAATGANGGVALISSTTVAHGVRIIRGGGGTDLIIVADGNFNGTGTLQTLVTGLADDTIQWVRFQISGGNIRARTWTDGGSEPGSYGSDVAISGSTASLPLGLLSRASTATSFKNLGYSIGIDTGAPSF